MEAGYSYTATEGHLQGFELCCEIAHECRAENSSAEFVLATVSVTVSLGAKPAQAEGECLIVHRLDTVALLHTCFPCLQTCQTHLTILPTHSRWLKVCQKTELHLILFLSLSFSFSCSCLFLLLLFLYSWSLALVLSVDLSMDLFSKPVFQVVGLSSKVPSTAWLRTYLGARTLPGARWTWSTEEKLMLQR